MHQLENVVVVVKLGQQRTARFALLWVRNVITVVCSTISLRYVGENLIMHEIHNKKNRINNVETTETTNQNSSQENQNVNYINYNKQINSDYDSSDNNYVATVENISLPQIALKNISITIANTDCDLLLDSGSGCTIINLSIMYNCPQSQWSEKKPL